MLHQRLSVSVAAVAWVVLGAAGLVPLIAWAQTDTHTDHQGHANTASMSAGEMPGMEMPPSAGSPTSTPAVPQGLSPVTLGPVVQQRIGVTIGTAEITPLVMAIRTVGIVRPNETRVAHIHLKTEGWVQKLFVSFTGQNVKASDPMLSIYSPAFYSAQRELLIALQAAKAVSSPEQQIVVDAARQRLALWDVPEQDINALEKTGKTVTSLTLRSPINGTVLEKKAFEGQYVAPQDELFLIADLSTVWVQAKVYEYELPHVQLRMPATVTLPAFPDEQFTGRISFIDPTVEEPSRTVQVRIELPNEQGHLKPGMFANVLIIHEMGQGLTVPDSAVIRTGTRDLAYRAEGDGRFAPVEVKISPLHFEGRFQVLEGLKAGERVVTSANFLIDSESRLRAGGGSMAGMAGMEGMDMGGAGGKKPSTTR